MRTSKLLFLSASVLATALFAHCSSSTQGTCQETATCPPDASDGPPPLVCDTTKDPKDQAGCLDDRVGIFVDGAGGNDGNAGTKASPVKTIAKGLALATTLTRIYVCEGTYAEDVTLDASHDGVSIYGGYACGAWTYSGNKPQIGKGTLALKVDSLTKPITIEDVLVKAADGANPGESSIAAFVNAAAGGVVFNRVNLTAGAGKNAADGVPGSNYGAVGQSDPSIAGHDASGIAGGSLQTCANLCTDGKSSTGGQGGPGGANPGDGSGGSPALGGGVFGAKATSSTACTNGTNGGSATAAGDATSPTVLGSLTASGWAPGVGTDGPNGGPGQGGGGGGGGYDGNNTTGGGAGGGCGGCGGAGGKGGGGGGASIALAVVSSGVTLNASELHAGNAGNGGKGSGGQDGQLGGFAGSPKSPGCTGGTGGKGGMGGTSAGGVGGISVGILYKGTAPTADSATSTATTTGTFGTKGTGGKAGQNDGIDGVAQAVLQAP